MKSLLIQLLLLSLLFSSCLNKNQNSLVKGKVKGKVKSVTILTVSPGGDRSISVGSETIGDKTIIDSQVNISKPDTAKTIDIYDINGNLVEDNLYSLSHHLRWLNKYDDNNRFLKSDFTQNGKHLKKTGQKNHKKSSSNNK